MGTKSIHTLGDPQVDISRRYAEDEARLSEVRDYLTQDKLSIGVEVPTYGATFPELQKLFGIEKTKLPYATFPNPPENFSSSYTLSPSLLPSVGSGPELNDALAKIRTFQTKDKTETDEKKTMITSLTTLAALEQIKMTVDAKRNQYGKG